MLLNSEIILKILGRMIQVISEKYKYLDKLDSEIGDGEHGSNMHRGFLAIKNDIEKLKKLNPGELLLKAGEILVFNIGGASGPLYGTAFIEAGKVIRGKEEISEDEIIEMFDSSLKGIKNRGKTELGDKTMIDTLEPAVNKLKTSYLAGSDWEIALLEMKESAREGMNSTKDMIAVRGRASYLGQRAKGYVDPGAASMYLLLEAIVDTIVKKGE